MADNVGITPGSGAKAASREVTYSGETAQVQVVGLATFDGARASAVATGQDERIAALDAEIAETEATLAQLRSI